MQRQLGVWARMNNAADSGAVAVAVLESLRAFLRVRLDQQPSAANWDWSALDLSQCVSERDIYARALRKNDGHRAAPTAF